MRTQNTTATGAGISAAQQVNDRGETLALWVIVGESAINPLRWCVIGEGATAKQAWQDAYGPHGHRVRQANTRAEYISYEHYDRLMQAEANA
jgi:hypothetical protein